MSDDALIQEVADLVHEAGEAHHRAYHETDGVDPEWALWYAAWLQAHLGDRLGPDLTRSELCYLLGRADREHGASEGWPQKYAKILVERH